jgi:hypothetical protein
VIIQSVPDLADEPWIRVQLGAYMYLRTDLQMWIQRGKNCLNLMRDDLLKKKQLPINNSAQQLQTGTMVPVVNSRINSKRRFCRAFSGTMM